MPLDGVRHLVATEEAFAFPGYLEALDRLPEDAVRDLDLKELRFIYRHPSGMEWLAPLLDTGAGRLAVMDEAGVDRAVLSLVAPGVQLFDADEGTAMAREANDFLAERIAAHPDRFSGLAVVAPQDPERAALEAERAVTRLGLSGLVINCHTHGEYLDHPRYLPLWEAVAALDVPVYLHPRNPPPRYRDLLCDHEGQVTLAGALWGFHHEAGLHTMRLIVSGLFDRLPTLKLVLGHLGEGLPYYLWRFDYMYHRGYRLKGQGSNELNPGDYLRRNVWLTTSGIHPHADCGPTLRFCIERMGIERMMFAIDHPFQESVPAVATLRDLALSPADLDAIAWRNAVELFRLPSPPGEGDGDGGAPT